MRTLTLAMTSLLVVGCAGMPLYPSRPGSSTAPLVPDPLPAKLVVHVAATSEGFKHALDSTVPASGELQFDLRGPRPVKWTRSPFTLRFADARVEVKTDLTIEIEMPIIGKQSIPIQASVVGEPVITSDWKFRMQGAHAKLESKDMRLRTLQGLAGALETATKMTDDYLEGFSWDLTPRIKEAYAKVAAPITFKVGDADACATLKVTSIEAGPTVIAGGFEKDLAFVVEPSVMLPCGDGQLEPQPPPLSNVATLPSGPFTVVVPIAAKYDELARAMSAAFTDGKLHFSKDYPELYLANPEVYASQKDELVVKLHLSGPIKAAGISATLDGDLYFVGHPVVVDNELRIPDLEPSVETKSFLLGLKASLDHNGIRDQARAALKLDLGQRFAAVRQKLSNDIGFGGDLGCLRANVAKIEVTGVYPHASYLRVYVSTTAQAAVLLPCPNPQQLPVAVNP